MTHDDGDGPNLTSQIRLINAKQRREIFPCSEMTIWRMERDGRWPRHITSGGRNYWRLSEVIAAINDMSKPD